MAGPLSELLSLCLPRWLIAESANLEAASHKRDGSSADWVSGHSAVLGVCSVPTALLHVAVSWELVAKVETKTGNRSGSLGVRGYLRLGGGQVVSSFGKFLQSWCPGKSFCRRRE